MPKLFHEKFQIYGDNHEFIYHVNEPNSGSKYGHVEASDPDITVIIINFDYKSKLLSYIITKILISNVFYRQAFMKYTNLMEELELSVIQQMIFKDFGPM